MDEPYRGLAVAEVRKVLGFIDRLRAQGKSVVLISQHPGRVRDLRSITVLRQGQRVAVRQTRITTPEEIIGFITGAFEAARRTPSQRGATHEEVRS